MKKTKAKKTGEKRNIVHRGAMARAIKAGLRGVNPDGTTFPIYKHDDDLSSRVTEEPVHQITPPDCAGAAARLIESYRHRTIVESNMNDDPKSA